MHIATPLIAELAQQIGHTVAIAVWGARGATIVRIGRIAVAGARQHAPRHGVLAHPHGLGAALRRLPRGRKRCAGCWSTSASARSSARRRAAASAGMPPAAAAALVERLRAPAARGARARHQPLRGRGHRRASSAMSAPVFDHTGAIVLAGSRPSARPRIFDTALGRRDRPRAQGLRRTQVSQRLGATLSRP